MRNPSAWIPDSEIGAVEMVLSILIWSQPPLGLRAIAVFLWILGAFHVSISASYLFGYKTSPTDGAKK